MLEWLLEWTLDIDKGLLEEQSTAADWLHRCKEEHVYSLHLGRWRTIPGIGGAVNQVQGQEEEAP